MRASHLLKKIICLFVPSKRLRKKIRKARPIRTLKRRIHYKKHSLPANIKQIPILIISHNRLSCLSQLVLRLEEMGYDNLHIVDNASSYPPLLEFLKTTKHTVHFLKENYGPHVVWKSGLFDELIANNYYVVTDPDVLPVEQCPDDFLLFLLNVLIAFPFVKKVGFSLKIDDLPDSNPLKEHIVNWEQQHYREKKEYEGVPCYLAGTDTTFALYGPEPLECLGKFSLNGTFYSALRTGYPYCAYHLPWYSSVDTKTPEDLYYEQNYNPNMATWQELDSRQLKPYLLSYSEKVDHKEK